MKKEEMYLLDREAKDKANKYLSDLCVCLCACVCVFASVCWMSVFACACVPVRACVPCFSV